MKSSLFLQGLLWAYMLSFGLKLRKKKQITGDFYCKQACLISSLRQQPKANYKKK